MSSWLSVVDNAQEFPALSLHVQCLYIYIYVYIDISGWLLRTFLSQLVTVQELFTLPFTNLDGAVVFLSAFVPSGLGFLLFLLLTFVVGGANSCRDILLFPLLTFVVGRANSCRGFLLFLLLTFVIGGANSCRDILLFLLLTFVVSGANSCRDMRECWLIQA